MFVLVLNATRRGVTHTLAASAYLTTDEETQHNGERTKDNEDESHNSRAAEAHANDNALLLAEKKALDWWRTRAFVQARWAEESVRPL
jgi:hypothetical protein|tara:strand:- start:1382 stop:1645 length:264 start_codon:yes stop_codon:yes gene_type:complete